MTLREPRRPEARLWLSRFNTDYAQWLRGSPRRSALFAQMLTALRHLLEREPESEDLIESLSISLLFNGRNGISASQGLDLIKLSLEASGLRNSPAPNRAVACAWLESRRASFLLAEGLWFDARAACGRARAAIPADALNPIVAFLRSEIEVHEALAAEACLELAMARESFARASSLAAPLREQAQFVPLAWDTYAFVLGAKAPKSKEAISAIATLVHGDLLRVAIVSSVGKARCDALTGSVQREESALAALDAITQMGLGPVTPLDLVPIVRRNEPATAEAIMEGTVARARALKLASDDFERVLTAALAANLTERGAAAGTMLERTRQVAERPWPLLEAVALGLIAVTKTNQQASDAGSWTEDFIDAIQRLESQRVPELDSWRVRQLFDEPLQAAFRYALDEFTAKRVIPKVTATPRKGIKIRGTKEHTQRGPGFPGERAEQLRRRARLSSCVDFLQRGQAAFEKWGTGERTETSSPLTSPTPPSGALARDRLGRVEHALRSWRLALAVIERRCGNETVFIVVNGRTGINVMRADDGWRAAACALREKFADENAALQLTGMPGLVSEIERVAQRAFRALPDALRDAIAESTDILICPDYRANGEQTPFELLHDGTRWLALEKVIARMPSLRALTLSVEGRRRRDSHQRLLAVTVPDAPGVDYVLDAAAAEVAEVRETLGKARWDAPEIDTARVTPRYLVHRLALATHVHVSAHGERDAEGDHIVLRGGNLYPRDLFSRFFAQAPTVYLNTCSLGSSHYLGGGLSHGIAHTLVEIGAPAVVANLLPIADESSALLGREFYASGESFGVALREARRACAKNFASPIYWGSTVLIGDPRVTLNPTKRPLKLSEELLDAFFLDPTDSHVEAVRERAASHLLTDPDDVRLLAAVGFIQFVSKFPAQPGTAERPRLIEAFRAACELDHLPAAAMMAVILAQTFDDEIAPAESAEMLNRAIAIIEPLEKQNAFWGRCLDQLLVRWIQIQHGDRRIRAEVRGPVSGEAAEEHRGLGQAIFDLNLAQEARKLRRGMMDESLDGASREHKILADAVQVSRSFEIDDAPETAAYARMVVHRLIEAEALPSAVAELATTALAGFLPWLWGAQHKTDLPKEMIEGQAGAIAELVASLRQQWPPQASPWFDSLRDFPSSAKAALNSFGGYAYGGELHRRMTEVFTAIEAQAETHLAQTKAQYPTRLPDATAWILGCLIEMNTYSYVDVSVPEEISRRLKSIHGKIAARGEGLFMPWLNEGFRGVRERPLNELDRWHYGIEPLEHKAETQTSTPARAAPRPKKRRPA